MYDQQGKNVDIATLLLLSPSLPFFLHSDLTFLHLFSFDTWIFFILLLTLQLLGFLLKHSTHSFLLCFWSFLSTQRIPPAHHQRLVLMLLPLLQSLPLSLPVLLISHTQASLPVPLPEACPGSLCSEGHYFDLDQDTSDSFFQSLGNH